MTEKEKREREYKLAMRTRVSELLPFVKGDVQNEIARKLGDGLLNEEQIKTHIDSNIIEWPQLVGEIEKPDKEGKYEVEVNDALIKKSLAILNKYLGMRFYPTEFKYKIEDVNSAEVKIATKFSLTGLRYLGLLVNRNGLPMHDTRKFRLLLSSKGETKRAIKQSGQQYSTSQAGVEA